MRTDSEPFTPVSADVDFGLELMRPDWIADPHPLLHRMRREDPVHYSRALRAWLVTRYDDVLQAFHDARLGGDRPRFFMGQLAATDRGVLEDFERIEEGMMINKEGPEHLRLRRLVQHGSSRPGSRPPAP